MQSTSLEYVNKLKRAHSASGTPRVSIEWNCNRFGTLEKISNGGVSPEADDPYFPLSSIISPRRPEVSGLVKGITRVGPNGLEAKASNSSEFPSRRRTYTASQDAKYKYWISPEVSSSTLVSGGYSITDCAPEVVYKYGQYVNKLVAQFENSGSNPMNVVIQFTRDGVLWETAGTNYTPGADGRIELYLQDNNTWSPVVNNRNVKSIRGIRAIVPRMSKARVHCHVIEIALLHQIDVTDRSVNFSVDSKASEASFVAPLGRAESSTGSLTLSNIDGYFDADRLEDGMLYGRNNSPAKVIIDTEVEVDGEIHNSRMMTMLVETWGEQTEEDHILGLSDASMFLKKEYPPAMLLERCTGTELIWRLLDSVGFTDFRVDESPDGDTSVRYFWTDPEKTVWDHIREICEGLQIACFFDEYGVIVIRARERMYEADKSTVDWTFDGQTVTEEIASTYSRTSDLGKLADIVSLSKPNSLEANKVITEYSPITVSPLNKFQPKMDQVWEPEGTVALRTATLANSMSKTQTYGQFADSNFSTWPYEGTIQLDGEIMKWTAKRYKYIDSDNVWKYKYIKSDAEKDALDGLNSLRSHLNKFDGRLYFGDNRGMMSTIPRDHSVFHKFSMIRYRHKDGPLRESNKYITADYKNSTFRIRTPRAFGASSWVTARRGSQIDAAPRYIGTSLKFDSNTAYTQGSAGVWIGGASMDAGYYVELSLTSWAGKHRGYVNEVSLYVRKADGTISRVGKGAVVGVARNKWYDLDVYQKKTASGFELVINVNGVTAMAPTIPFSQALSTDMPGWYGVFARGNTYVMFEYLYAATSIEEVPMSGEDSSRWDLIEGGYRSNYYNKYLHTTKNHERLSNWSVDRRTRNIGFSFDDFGPKAHEIREFDVSFSITPVIHSRLYLSNEWYADCIEYTADHDGARFTVVGKGRDNVILNGEDTLIYGSENPVDQKMFVYGRTVTTEDAQKYEVRNEKSISRTGEVELSISSPWIQSEAAAKKIGDWVANHWGNGSEVIELESFGNPLIQIGDIVAICYMRKGMTPDTHRYYVTGKTHNYDTGLTTSYTLQRKTNLVS